LVCSSTDPKKLVAIKETPRETTLTLASSHALVILEDGQVVGDPMEKTTLEALGWEVAKGKLSLIFVLLFHLLRSLTSFFLLFDLLVRRCHRPQRINGNRPLR
jgi:hypothetical protein